MGNAGRNGGEYYTPRPLIKTIVKVVSPKIGNSIYDSSLFTKSTRSSPVIALWSTFPFLSFGAAQVTHLNFDSIILS
jgi:hypothetical protein